MSKCLVRDHCYATLSCRPHFEMKSVQQWDVTTYSVKKESSQLIGKDFGISSQYCKDSGDGDMGSSGTNYEGLLMKTEEGRKYALGHIFSPFPVCCTAGKVLGFLYPTSQLASHLTTHPPSIHPPNHPSTICPPSCLFTYLSISSFHQSIYSTSIEEIQG